MTVFRAATLRTFAFHAGAKELMQTLNFTLTLVCSAAEFPRFSCFHFSKMLLRLAGYILYLKNNTKLFCR